MNRRDFLVKAAATAACGAAYSSFSTAESPVKPDYTLRIQPVSVELAKGNVIRTIGYNGTTPGPLLRLERGKKANILVFNETDTPELVHWHGLHIDSLNDGAMEEGSPMIAPHGQQLYSFTPEPDGSRWYHTHTSAEANLKVATYTGQYGFLYIDPKQNTGSYDQEVFLAVHHWEPMMMPMGPPINSLEVGYKYASFNDKLHSAAEPLRVKQGQRVLFHFLNASATQDVSLALPGHTFKVIALDGNPVPNPQAVATISLSVAERVDAIVEMNQPGVWILGSTDDAEQKKGLGLTIEYAGSKGAPQWKDPGKNDWNYTLFGKAPTPGFPAKRFPMVFEKHTGAASGGLDLWTINGKGFPDIPAIEVQQGKRYRLSFVNTTGEPHPVHLHRHSFELANVAGKPTGGIFKDTVSVDAYSKVEVDFIANNPGPTLFHCHQQLHMDYGFMQMIHYV
jgi:FtsP/CotA-like multicopper oxidase with cupredoxin domain